jgi:hypothetical protein
MNIEHSGLLSWVHERHGRASKTQKPCARLRDVDRIKSASGDPAMVLMFRMASILSLITGTVPVTSSGRIAAGHCTFEHGPFGKLFPLFGIMLLRRIVFQKPRKAIPNDHARSAR